MCRRQFNLETEPTRYADLSRFDQALMLAMKQFKWSLTREFVTAENENSKYIVYERGPCVFVISFFYNEQTVVCPVHEPGKYKVVLDSDEPQFGGTGSAKLHGVELFTKHVEDVEEEDEWQLEYYKDFEHAFSVLLKPRHGIILERID